MVHDAHVFLSEIVEVVLLKLYKKLLIGETPGKSCKVKVSQSYEIPEVGGYIENTHSVLITD